MKFKTVPEGEQAVVFNHLGQGELLVGPQRIFLFRKRLQFLDLCTANQYQYLVVKDKDGRVTHRPGPCSMFCNPLEHESIYVRDGTQIDANHVVVVYKKRSDQVVERRVIDGPTVFMPEAEEWLHEFKWHGPDYSNEGRMVPGSWTFSQLPVIPDHFYYNIGEVRTIDDTMITVKLMIFCELKDIIKMLETTHDPMADMINGVCADVIAFAGKLTYEEFLRQTQKLSTLETFPQLLQRAERIGYDINKVVYRGYHATKQLQSMHDDAIQSRTQLRLTGEVHEQQQRLKDFVLSREQARTQQKQDMERSKQQHNQKLEELQQEHELKLTELRHQAELQKEDIESKARLEIEKAKDDHAASYLKNLQDLGVDMTRYLVSQQPAPIDQEIRVNRTT
ncbi:uncharacterized protein LOC106177368 [Lingula anatina]|uniref:Uncharacterized protein LOC106177368 n=1 Tax=Lingula anatina TaxID=7574 RepID=A0A1S3JZP0_LINAN|nr:uncharacterized protein LOC106177368 [Lingula anatina]|eukprot:XP_013415569.1 uncharacterized protein LOC106177368 [Lingula anatina]